MSTYDEARERIRALHGRGADAPLGRATVADYAAVTARHRGLYWSVPGPLLFETVDAHARLGRALLGARAPAALHSRLAEAAAESLLLAGRIAFFDLRAPSAAGEYLRAASDAADAAENDALGAAILSHRAFIPAYAGHAQEARGLIGAARDRGGSALSGVQSGWMHAVAAEVEARLGEGGRAMGLLARSADELAADGEPCPAWLDYFDAARHGAFTGYCASVAGLPEQAEAALTRSLGALAPAADKQRAIVHADLASVLLAGRRIDECVAHLREALSIVDQQWYATAVHRIRELRVQLVAHRRLPEVADLDERLRALTRVRTAASPPQAEGLAAS
jgi:tetratricopeptide (TPR) repeat protein